MKDNKEIHTTEDGYCCACDYDIAGFEGKLQAQKKELKSIICKDCKKKL